MSNRSVEVALHCPVSFEGRSYLSLNSSVSLQNFCEVQNSLLADIDCGRGDGSGCSGTGTCSGCSGDGARGDTGCLVLG
jgi:hypothetical protein